MPQSKKYKLHSAEQSAGGKPVCAFFLSDAGCRSGDGCKFLHSTNAKSGTDKMSRNKQSQNGAPIMEISETSSVISSESEGGQQQQHQQPQIHQMAPMDMDPFADEPPKSATKNQQQQGEDQPNKKKKKRKNKSKKQTDLFAAPKNESHSNGIHGKGNDEPKPNKKQKIHAPDAPSAAGKQEHRATSAPSSSTPDFRSFLSGLPVASFSTPNANKTPDKKEEPTQLPVASAHRPPGSFAAMEFTAMEPSSRNSGTHSPVDAPFKRVEVAAPQLPVYHPQRLRPESTEVGRKWLTTVLKSRQHERYDTSYDFARYKENDARNSIQSTWVKAKPFGPWCQSNPQAIAIDCEMCETTDPLSGAKDHKALCRVSVINAENPEEILLDTLVKPAWPVSDYRTRINGISKEDLDNVEFTLRHAQAFLMRLCSQETVIVGHAVHNDLDALKMEHDVIADSSCLFRAKDSTSATVSLRDTVMTLFKVDMPETHDSVNDARKALECVAHWMGKDGNVELVERTAKNHAGKIYGHQLFVHRIPKLCNGEHLINMFLKHTTVQPTEVEEIQFSGESGKTHVLFKTARHANLAFDSLDGNAEEEKSGRLQKKVYLRNGDYVRVRKMIHAKRPNVDGQAPPNDGSRRQSY